MKQKTYCNLLEKVPVYDVMHDGWNEINGAMTEYYIKRLKHLIATALGLYMARRVMGESANVQLKRLKRLQDIYGEYQKSE